MRRVPLLVVVWMVCIACGSPSSTQLGTSPPVQASRPADVAPTAAVAAQTAAPSKASYPGLPDTVAAEHLAWLLDAIVNRRGVITQAEVDKRLHAKFLAAVPADKFIELTKSLVALGVIEVKSAKGSELSLRAQLATKQGSLLALVEVDPDTKQVVGLLFRPDPGDAPKPTTFAEALDMTAKLAPHAQLLVAAVDKGTCKPLHATASKQPLAIGSTFKLYVLLGLVDKILAKKATWQDEIEIRDDWKSLPSGVTQNDTAGSKLSIKTLAERMISISDNTATDHLLYSIGRKQAEAALRSTKHAAAALNVPMFSTRELFLFKLGMSDSEIDRFRMLPEAKRREYLDTTLAGQKPDITKAEGWNNARYIDQLEWFAAAGDLCNAMGALWKRGQKEPAKPLFDVLAKNPGIEIDPKAWPYIGFKGGSEPGVINLTWLVRRSDDKWFSVVLTANAPEGTVDHGRATAIAAGVFELLAKDAKNDQR